MILGTITTSDSQVRYLCQVYGPGDVEVFPSPADYAFGRFVKIALTSPLQYGADVTSTGQRGGTAHFVVGIICNTILSGPAPGSGGPRLSTAEQMPVFTPDYLNERCVFVVVLTLGMMETHSRGDGPVQMMTRVQGVPLSCRPDSPVETMTDEEIREFHRSSKEGVPLEMGYLSHLRSEGAPFFAAVGLVIIQQLELLLPQGAGALSIIKRNLSWQHIVAPMR